MLGWRNSTGSQALTWPDPWVQLTIPWTSPGFIFKPRARNSISKPRVPAVAPKPNPFKKKKDMILEADNTELRALVLHVTGLLSGISWFPEHYQCSPLHPRGDIMSWRQNTCSRLYNYRELDTVCIHIKGKYGLWLSGRCQRRLWDWPPARQSTK